MMVGSMAAKRVVCWAGLKAGLKVVMWVDWSAARMVAWKVGRWVELMAE